MTPSSINSKITPLLLAPFLLGVSAERSMAASYSTWQNTSGGTALWSSGTNWNSGIPGDAGLVYSGSLTNTVVAVIGSTTNKAITLDSNYTVQGIQFNTAGTTLNGTNGAVLGVGLGGISLNATNITINPAVLITGQSTTIFYSNSSNTLNLAGGLRLDNASQYLTVNSTVSISGTVMGNLTAVSGYSTYVPTAGTTKLGFTGNGTVTISGVIQDNGLGNVTALSYNGYGSTTDTFTGSLTVTNANNSFTGGVYWTAGTLIVGANSLSGVNGALGNSTSAISFGATTSTVTGTAALLIGGTYTIGRDILVKANTGSQVAMLGGNNTSGTSTYTGNITIGSSGNTRTLTLVSGSGGTTVFKTGSWVTNNSAIVIGTGTYAGTVELDNNVTTTGGVSVNVGQLKVNSTLTSNVAVASGASVIGSGTINGATAVTSGTINGSGLTLGATTLHGASALSGVNNASSVTIADGTTTLSGTTTATGGFSVNGATLAGSGQGMGTVSGSSATINGSGLSIGATTLKGNSTLSGYNIASRVTVNSGTTSLTGTTQSTGTLSVSAGATLNANGTIAGSASVSGLLSGNSTVTGNLALTSGTISPGNSAGITTVEGNLTVDHNSTLVAQVSGTVAGISYDQVKVSGNVTLDGTLDLTSLSGLTMGETITLIDNTGSGTTTGYFSTILTSGSTYTVTSNSNYTFTSGTTEYLLSFSSKTDGDANYNDVTLSVVPEPSTWAMLVGGVGMLAFGQRLRRK